MTRNIKALGLALLAAFAFSAIVAQGASAVAEEHEFETTGEQTTVLTGHQETGENHHTFTIGETVLTCHIATFEGTMAGVRADHVELVPTYKECHSNIEKTTNSAKVTVNGCTFTFDSDTQETVTNEVAETHAPVSMTCPAGKDITIVQLSCVIHVLPFEGLHGVTYTNLPNHGPGGKDAVTVTATVTGIPTTTTGGLACLAAGLGFAHKTWESTYTGKTEVTGYEDLSSEEEGTEHEYIEGNQTNIAVTGTPEE